jgi:predicted nucleic acid-binding protein
MISLRNRVLLGRKNCRANGVHGSNTDFLICSVAINHQLPVFTLDRDFVMVRRWLDFEVYRG